MVVLVLLLVVLLVAGLVGLLIVAAVGASRRAAQRRNAIAGYALHREWEYRPSDPALVDRFRQPPFGRGHNRRAENVILGRHGGRAFTAFDYRFVTSNGETSTTHTHSVLALHLGVPAPPLTVGPSGTMSRLWDKVVRSDIRIGDPAFDHAFLVKSTSPEFARDVLHPDVVEVLWHHQHLAWRFEADSMVVFRAGQQGSEEIEAKLHFMDAVLDRIPAHVWDRLRGEQPR